MFCLFTEFHSSITTQLHSEILSVIKDNNSNIWVIFATTALRMGVDANSIRPPITMESFIQKIGRAGRDTKEASALLHYNNFDLVSPVIAILKKSNLFDKVWVV